MRDDLLTDIWTISSGGQLSGIEVRKKWDRRIVYVAELWVVEGSLKVELWMAGYDGKNKAWKFDGDGAKDAEEVFVFTVFAGLAIV